MKKQLNIPPNSYLYSMQCQLEEIKAARIRKLQRTGGAMIVAAVAGAYALAWLALCCLQSGGVKP